MRVWEDSRALCFIAFLAGCTSSPGPTPDGASPDARRDATGDVANDLATPGPDAAGDDASPPGDAGLDATTDAPPPTRGEVLVAALTGANATVIRERPTLVAGMFTRMAGDAYSFFRGTLPVFLHDWRDPASGLGTSSYGVDTALPLGLGDAHPENFGTLRTRTGTFRVEPNDFDSAERLPYLWDVRRLAVGMCMAARLANEDNPGARSTTSAQARAIARAAADSYATTMAARVGGAAPGEIAGAGGNPIFEDMFSRSQRDTDDRRELADYTVLTSVRRLRRGVLDPVEPTHVYRDLPPATYAALPDALTAYRATLTTPPAPEYFTLLDAVQELGSGVGSWPRVRVILLVRGPSDAAGDDVMLELKELPPPGALSLPTPSTFATPQERLLTAMRAGWTQPDADPLWGASSWLVFPTLTRTESEGFKTVRVARMVGDRGTVTALTGLGRSLGMLLARMHASAASDTGGIAAAINAQTSRAGFADEQADAAIAYCDRVMSDWALFRDALGRLGPTLGVAGDPASVASPDLRALFDVGGPTPADAGVPSDSGAGTVVVNEIRASGDEWVELYNAGTTAFDLSGYGVADSDSSGMPRGARAARFPAGTSLAPGGYLLVVAGLAVAGTGPQTACVSGGPPTCYHATWSISASSGESVWLLSPSDAVVASGAYPAGTVPSGQTWSRLPNGTGAFANGRPTPGAANAAP